MVKVMKKTVKKALITTAATVALFGAGLANTVEAANFKDVKSSHWAYSNIETVAKKGLVAGYEDGKFKPSNNVTRAEFATFLSRMFDGTERTQEPFTDVADSHWAKDAIEEGLALGFIGTADFKNNKFEPNQKMTRQEIAKWLANGLKASNAEYGTMANEIQNGKYTLLPIAEYYKGGLNKSEYGNVGLMLGTGLMSGFEDGSFKATGNTTRAEVATILIRFGEAMKKAPSNFKGLNELVEVATTGTNMLSASKFSYWGIEPKDFSTVLGKPFTFTRNNAGVATLERIIFIEGTNLQATLNSSIYAKMFMGKNSRYTRTNNSANVITEFSFTPNKTKTTIDAYSNGNTNALFSNVGVRDKQLVKNYGLTTLDADNWGAIFQKGKKVKYWTSNVLDQTKGEYIFGFTTDDKSDIAFQVK